MSNEELYLHFLSLTDPEKKSTWNQLAKDDRPRFDDLMTYLKGRKAEGVYSKGKLKGQPKRESAYKDLSKIIRDEAIIGAWDNERELIKQGKGTYNWSIKQQEIILASKPGTKPSFAELNQQFPGHHMVNAADHPEFAGLSENIQFLEGSAFVPGTEHRAAHNGNPHNPTDHYYDTITEMRYKFVSKGVDDGFPPVIQLIEVCPEVEVMDSYKNAFRKDYSNIIPNYDSLTDDNKLLAQKFEYIWSVKRQKDSSIPYNFEEYIAYINADGAMKSSDDICEKLAMKLFDETGGNKKLIEKLSIMSKEDAVAFMSKNSFYSSKLSKFLTNNANMGIISPEMREFNDWITIVKADLFNAFREDESLKNLAKNSGIAIVTAFDILDFIEVSVDVYYGLKYNTMTEQQAVSAITETIFAVTFSEVGASVGTTIGASIFSIGGPIGTFIGTVLGGIAGGTLGYIIGRIVGGEFYDKAYSDVFNFIDSLYSDAHHVLEGTKDNDCYNFANGKGTISDMYKPNRTYYIESFDGNDYIAGYKNDDTIVGGQGFDMLVGCGGNDEIYGDEIEHSVDGGNDIIYGGSGNDTIYGSGGDDIIYGKGIWTNNDLMGENDGVFWFPPEYMFTTFDFNPYSEDDLTDNDTIHGESGNDLIYGGIGTDEIYGGYGDDTIYGENDDDHLYGNTGNDYIVGGNGSDYVEGGKGDDYIFDNGFDTYGNYDTMYGQEGDDVIIATNASKLVGGAGNDIIEGSNSNDRIFGDEDDYEEYDSDGNDDISAGDGYDYVRGGGGDDIIKGGNDNDILCGDCGDDELYGDAGNDSILGGSGKDSIYGGIGTDTLFGDNDDDIIYGGDGFDNLYGGNGYDELYGGEGNDFINGGENSDVLYGEAHNDKLFGDSGRDVLSGGEGDDELYGGEGQDSYFFGYYYGHDTIVDLYDDISHVEFGYLDFEDISFDWCDNGNDVVVSFVSTDKDSLTIKQFKDYGQNFYFWIDDESYQIINENGELVLEYKELPKNSATGSVDSHFNPWNPLHDSGSSSNAGKYKTATAAQPPRDPLVFDFDNDEIEPVGLDKGVYFDLDNNGFAENTAWVGPNDGFLVFDRNGDGFITNGTELFSDQIILSDGRKSVSGFDALAEFDSNHNDVIDIEDNRFNELYIWLDKNQNGKVDINVSDKEKELFTLFDKGIDEISLKVTEIEPKPGEVMSTAYSDVSSNGKKIMTIVENWFSANTSNTQEINSEPVDNDFTSFGHMHSLGYALSNDESGELKKLVKLFNDSRDYVEKRVLSRKIMYYIADATSITGYRGGVEARNLHVIETVMGVESFIGVNGSTTPNTNASVILNELFSDFDKLYYNLLNASSSAAEYINMIGEYTDVNGNRVLNLNDVEAVIEQMILFDEDPKHVLLEVASYLSVYDYEFKTSYCSNFIAKFADYSSNIMDMINCQYLVGTQGEDTMNGSNSDEIIWSDADNDTINAAGGNDIIYGGSENDTINGNNGNDSIYGEEGNDILNGGDGDDSYYIDANHGNDVIRDTKGDNKLIFTDGLSADDYEASINAKLGFVLTHKETGEIVSLTDFLTNPLNYNFNFEGGSDTEESITNREVFEGTAADDYIETGDGFNISYGGDGNDTLAGGKDIDFMYGGNGDDLVLGRNGVNVLFGEEGNDTIYDGDHGSYLNGGNGDDMLYGGGGADVLDGGAGNDCLQGDHGNDTYIFSKGYDTDTINSSSDVNTIIIKGYSASSMINTRNAHNDLIIHFGSEDSTDCLIVDHFFDYNSNRDMRFEFENGTVLGQYDIKAKFAPIEGTENSEWMGIQTDDDMIYRGYGGHDGIGAGNGNDTLDGGTGNDVLNGGNGTDTYIFAKGYGNDSINEWGTDKSIIKFTDINSDEVTIDDQWGNLLVTVNDTEDTLTINSFKWGQSTYSFEFADGAIASVNKDTFELEFSKLPDIPEVSEDEIAQTNVELLTELYAEDSVSADLISETDTTVISEVTDSTTVADEADEISDQTDIQVMILTESMSAFADEANVYDTANITDTTTDTALNQLLVNSAV